MVDKKILNDPVHGFINVLSEHLFPLIEHPYIQRLRRIKQLGLTCFVYQGALHTRLQHTLGATHLMNLAIEVLRSKGVEITEKEADATQYAILLHDVGHGPFSHALEHSILSNISHEIVSTKIMEHLNIQMEGKLDLAIRIFNNQYHKPFLHQLISSHLDVDRLDYLKRDSFFTGVSEGIIGTERIIKMLYVYNNHLVVEAKGLHSIENYLISRKLMYLQVYLHKTVIAAEQMLVKAIQRAKHLEQQGIAVESAPVLSFFLKNDIQEQDLLSPIKFNNRTMTVLDIFALLDDNDIFSSLKQWSFHSDSVLSDLSSRLLNRRLFKIKLKKEPFDTYEVETLKATLPYDDNELNYYFIQGKTKLTTEAQPEIQIYYNDNKVLPLSEVTDIINTDLFSRTDVRHYLCYPKQYEES
jgi:HD superfamily phosphohydrolase